MVASKVYQLHGELIVRNWQAAKMVAKVAGQPEECYNRRTQEDPESGDPCYNLGQSFPHLCLAPLAPMQLEVFHMTTRR